MKNSSYAIALEPTPVLNTPHFRTVFGGKDGASLPLEGPLKLNKAIEFIALKGTKFQIIERLDNHIVSVKTLEYPQFPLYVDERFLKQVEAHFPERPKILPSKNSILKKLPAFEGMNYVWGGNWSHGIKRIPLLYPWEKTPDVLTLVHWSMKGVDCSGLLYEVTDGFTARNTSELISFGQPVPIDGCSQETIASRVMPLDLIVWPGHVVIVLNAEETIESLGGKGVIRMKTVDRLEQIMATRKAKDSPQAEPFFVIRRWHPEVAY